MANPRQNAKTPFGRYMERRRIERKEQQRDSAALLGISDAYMSSIEVGRRNVPRGMLDKLIAVGYATDAEREMLEHLIYLSRTKERVDVGHLSLEQRRLVHMFASRLPELRETDIEAVRSLLEPEV